MRPEGGEEVAGTETREEDAGWETTVCKGPVQPQLERSTRLQGGPTLPQTQAGPRYGPYATLPSKKLLGLALLGADALGSSVSLPPKPSVPTASASPLGHHHSPLTTMHRTQCSGEA